MLLLLGPTMSLAALVQTALSLVPLVPMTVPPALRPPTAVPRQATPPASAGADLPLLPRAATSAVDGHPSFVPPLRGGLTVLDRFRPPATTWAPGHRGVDLAASPGDAVLTAGAGLVIWAGDLAGRGVVSVRHGDGRRTTYEPVAPTVEAGDLVGPGELIGWLVPGVSHCGGVPSCLHWGLITQLEDYADPLSLIAPGGRPRLLPLGAGAP